jgi:hypothetical protein
MSKTGTLDTLDITILKDKHQSVSIAELHEFSSNHLPVLLKLGENKASAKLWERSFTDWIKFTATVEASLFLDPSTPPTPSVLEDAFDSFEGALAATHATRPATKSHIALRII